MYIEDFIKITTNTKAIDELKIEMIGLLSHMRLGDVWADYLQDSFLEFIITNVNTKEKEEDLVLETLGLISNLCASKKSCAVIANSKILTLLPEIMDEKQEDDEFVL